MNSDLSLILTSDNELWLLNASNAQIDAGPGELCGFNTGTCVDKPRGTVT